MKRLGAAAAAIFMAGAFWTASAGAVSCIPEKPSACPTTTQTSGLGRVTLTHAYGTPYSGAPKTTTSTVAVAPPVAPAVPVAAQPAVTG